MYVRVCVYVREYIQLTHPAQREIDIAELQRKKGGEIMMEQTPLIKTYSLGQAMSK